MTYKVAGIYNIFLSFCLNSYIAGTDQYYMDLMYVGNTDAQMMNKVHS